MCVYVCMVQPVAAEAKNVFPPPPFSNQNLGRCGVVIVGYVEQFINIMCLCRCGSEPEVSFHYILLMFPSFPVPHLWHVVSNYVISHMISFYCLICLFRPFLFCMRTLENYDLTNWKGLCDRM